MTESTKGKADSRVSRAIAQFWGQLNGTRDRRAAALPDETDIALAEYLSKHKIGVLEVQAMSDAEEADMLVSAQARVRELEEEKMTIMEMIGREITKAWEKALEGEDNKVARGRVRGLAQALAVMRKAPNKFTAQDVKNIEEEFRP